MFLLYEAVFDKEKASAGKIIPEDTHKINIINI